MVVLPDSHCCWNCGKKAVRLLLPYFFFALFGIVPRVLAPGMVNGETSIAESIKSIFLYGGEYWFLYTLFLIFAIFPLVEKAIQRNETASVIVVAALAVTSQFLPKTICIDLIAYYLLLFALGYIGKMHSVFDMAVEKKTWVIVPGAVIVCLCGFLHGRFNYAWLNAIEAIIGIVYCAFASKVMPRVFSKFGKFSLYSLALYLLNGYWLVVSRMIIVNTLHVSNPAIIILFNVVIDFYVSFLVIKYIVAKIPVIRTLCGIQIKK